jgi:hypothetical protein
LVITWNLHGNVLVVVWAEPHSAPTTRVKLSIIKACPVSEHCDFCCSQGDAWGVVALGWSAGESFWVREDAEAFSQVIFAGDGGVK